MKHFDEFHEMGEDCNIYIPRFWYMSPNQNIYMTLWLCSWCFLVTGSSSAHPQSFDYDAFEQTASFADDPWQSVPITDPGGRLQFTPADMGEGTGTFYDGVTANDAVTNATVTNASEDFVLSEFDIVTGTAIALGVLTLTAVIVYPIVKCLVHDHRRYVFRS